MKSYKTLKIKQKENNSIILKKELTMDLKKQILVALGLDKQDEVALEYQAKLEDGTLIVSTSTNLEAGLSYKESELKKLITHFKKNKLVYVGVGLVAITTLIALLF